MDEQDELTYPLMNSTEKINVLLDNRWIRYERALVAQYAWALRRNDRETTMLFESYGEMPHQIIMNIHSHECGKRYGYNVFVFDEYGWQQMPKWKTETISLTYSKKNKEFPNNYITLAQSPNGMWQYGVRCNGKDSGVGWYPSIYDDPFNTRQDAIDHACNYIVSWHRSNPNDHLNAIENKVKELMNINAIQLELF